VASELGLCSCGCGRKVKTPGARWVRGHNLMAHHAEHSAKIAQRWLESLAPAELEALEGSGDPDQLSPVERQRISAEVRAARAAFWSRPTVSEDGELVPPELPEEKLLLPWEDRERVIALEAPTTYEGVIEYTELGYVWRREGHLPTIL